MTGNSAWYGGAVFENEGTTSLKDCTLTGGFAVRGGAIYNYGTMTLDDCIVKGNTAKDFSFNGAAFGGALYAAGGTVDLNRCTITGNTADYDGGAVDNEGGTFVFNDCTVRTNTASRGGAAFSTGRITWNRCSLSGNSASSAGGALYQYGGETFWNDCTLIDNHATNDGAVAYSEASSTTRVDRCTFVGEYSSNTCVFYSDDTDSKFQFYYQQQEFESGVVCSASQVVVYNSNVSIPLSTSHEETIITCQSSEILNYCEYECSTNDGAKGISCSCTSDDQQFDPELLDDKGAQSCLNSGLLNVPQTYFTLALTKQREPHSFQIAFANAGDKPLKWNVTRSRSNGTAVPWLITPRTGVLIGCDLGTISVALPTWNLTARSDPYALQLELTSNSYRDAIRSLSVDALVSAEPMPSLSFITIKSLATQLAAGSTVDFIVTPIDAAGIAILGASGQAYFAALSHPESNTSVSCRVVFDTSSGEQQGACEIPALLCDADALCSPPVGSFVLGVKDSSGMVVGAT